MPLIAGIGCLREVELGCNGNLTISLVKLGLVGPRIITTEVSC